MTFQSLVLQHVPVKNKGVFPYNHNVIMSSKKVGTVTVTMSSKKSIFKYT